MKKADRDYETNLLTRQPHDVVTELTIKETDDEFERELKHVYGRMRSIVKKFMSEGGDVTVIQNIVLETLKDAASGQKITGRKQMKHTGNGTAKIKKESSQKSLSVVEPETLPTVSHTSSTDLQGANSDSMNLLDRSGEHLYGLMVGMTAEKPPTDIRTVGSETVKAAAEAAKQIVNLMKVKLEILKFKKEIDDDETTHGTKPKVVRQTRDSASRSDA